MLKKEKELTRSEGSKFKREISGRADDLKNWIGDKIDQRMDEVLKMMNLATKEQVADLKGRIDALTKKVNKLEKSSDRRDKEENAKTKPKKV